MPYRAGAAARDITPTRELIASGKIWLWGYGNRSAPCEGVHSPISVRALAVTDDDDNTVILVALDVGMLAPEMTARIRARCIAAFGIPPQNVCMNVSHTHGAPVIVSLPTWPLGIAHAQLEYVAFVERQVFGAIADALARREPARLTWGRGATNIGRDRHFKGDLRSYDPTLDVLLVRSATPSAEARSDGRTALATVFTTPCHPVCNADLNEIYSDFPGIARTAVELELGGIGFFLQGCAGTCVPGPLGEEKASETLIGERLSADVITIARGSRDELNGPLDVRLHTIELPLQPVDEASLPAIRDWGETLRVDRSDLAELIERWTDHVSTSATPLPRLLPTQQQVICIGSAPDEWYLLASSHEVSMDFGPRVRALWPAPRVSVIGYTNSQLSYLPSAQAILNPYAATDFPRDLSNYNYTAARSFLWYGHPGPLMIDADDLFMRGFMALRDAQKANAQAVAAHGTRLGPAA